METCPAQQLLAPAFAKSEDDDLLCEESGLENGVLGGQELCDITDSDLDDNAETLLTMFIAEQGHRPNKDHCNTVQKVAGGVEPWMRDLVVQWIFELTEELEMTNVTVAAAVNFLDRFLSDVCIRKNLLQMTAVACVLVACKMHEVHFPSCEDLCVLSRNMFDPQDLKEMELLILRTLNWNLNTVGPHCFVRRFVIGSQSDNAEKLCKHADFFADLSLCDYGFIEYTPSVTAAGGLLAASKNLSYSEDCLLHYFSMDPNINMEQILVCKERMLQLFYRHFPSCAPKADAPAEPQRSHSPATVLPANFGFPAQC